MKGFGNFPSQKLFKDSHKYSQNDVVLEGGLIFVERPDLTQCFNYL